MQMSIFEQVFKAVDLYFFVVLPGLQGGVRVDEMNLCGFGLSLSPLFARKITFGPVSILEREHYERCLV